MALEFLHNFNFNTNLFAIGLLVNQHVGAGGMLNHWPNTQQ